MTNYIQSVHKDRESHLYNNPGNTSQFTTSKITSEPELLALSPTSNSRNIFQSLTLPLPPLNGNHATTLHPPSPSHLNLTHSNHRVTPSPPGSARLYGSFVGDSKPPPSPGFGKTSFSSIGFPSGPASKKGITSKPSLDKNLSSYDHLPGKNSTTSGLMKGSLKGLDNHPEEPEPSSPSSSDRSELSSIGSEDDSQLSLSSYTSTNSSSSKTSDKIEPYAPTSAERHARSDSVSSVNSNSSNGPKTAYFTPPHTPTQFEPNNSLLSAQPTHAPKSHSSFFGYNEGSGGGGMSGNGRPPELNIPDDEYDRPPTPRTARPEDESGPGSGFQKALDGSGPALPPQLSAIGFYGQDYNDDESFSQRYSYSAYPASYEEPSFGGSFGYPPHGPHPYGDRERSSSFSSLYPPPSTDSVDSEGEGEDPMGFTVSTILPGFLFLGPEPTSWDHVKQLKELGVRRIVNLAAECGPDDWGLGLDKPGEKEKEGKQEGSASPQGSGFEKYYKIAMRDTVEEDGIGRGVRIVCEMLDHARLLSAPVYVHCKAGKSRSVTAVIAYLIHANHWPLSKAYSFVLERRKGISPNIGFVSELMGFEEEELGGKSGGVSGAAWGAGKGYAKHHHRQGGGPGVGAPPQPSAPAATREEQGGNAPSGSTSNNPEGFGMVASMRKSGHARESMPPSTTYAHHGYSYSVNEPSTTSRLLSDDNNGSGSGSSSGSNSASSSATASPEINGEYRAGALFGSNMAGNGGGTGAGQGPSFPPLSAGGILALGDAAQELEVRDANGRYRHARRAPVNETTLQPMRRVSKAGLESGEFYRGEGKMTWGEDEEEAVEGAYKNEQE
ncbi:hypothetical protein FB446DRAFT_746865 [Lentinula raphanica]|nr:hypothetical protein FB446DRAFT_746865 [Lentinula raphanica]